MVEFNIASLLWWQRWFIILKGKSSLTFGWTMKCSFTYLPSSSDRSYTLQSCNNCNKMNSRCLCSQNSNFFSSSESLKKYLKQEKKLIIRQLIALILVVQFWTHVSPLATLQSSWRALFYLWKIRPCNFIKISSMLTEYAV